MSRIAWDTVGERRFETGVDRGVLYVDDGIGVPWNGLVSVTETPLKGESKTYYLDGVKIRNEIPPEEFSATLSAFTYPDEFSACEGLVVRPRGLIVGKQRKKPFHLAYRTIHGNDLSGVDYGYKLHLVYNAVVDPSQKAYSTRTNSADPMTFSWDIKTTPEEISGYKPTSYFVVDSRYTPAAMMTELENILYGDPNVQNSTARMPTIEELIEVFEPKISAPVSMAPVVYANDPQSANFTPAAGALLFVVSSTYNSDHTISDTLGGLAWTKYTVGGGGGVANYARLSLWVARVASNPVNGHVKLTGTGYWTTLQPFQVVEYAALPLRQTLGDVGTYAHTLGSTPESTSLLVSLHASSASITLPTGWTALVAPMGATNHNFAAAYKLRSAAQTVTWTGNGSANALLTAEIERIEA